jgi:beta-glucosidase-like glycosyl hydrolase
MKKNLLILAAARMPAIKASSSALNWTLAPMVDISRSEPREGSGCHQLLSKST